MTILYWEYLPYKQWKFRLAATDQGLCAVQQPDQSLSALEKWASRHFPKFSLSNDEPKLAPYITQLNEYFQGHRQTFDLPLDLHGTDWQQSVWRALTKIPYGTTCSYADIAREINRPQAVRAVGAANRANPIPIIIPCHRVIGKNGRLVGYRGGLAIKEELLAIEGLTGFSK